MPLLEERASAEGHQIHFLQSNAEGELVDSIQQARKDGTNFIIINAGALSHTSIALRDALIATELTFIEVHLSNVYKREAFRHKSMIADCALGVIYGFGVQSYELALRAALQRIHED